MKTNHVLLVHPVSPNSALFCLAHMNGHIQFVISTSQMPTAFSYCVQTVALFSHCCTVAVQYKINQPC